MACGRSRLSASAPRIRSGSARASGRGRPRAVDHGPHRGLPIATHVAPASATVLTKSVSCGPAARCNRVTPPPRRVGDRREALAPRLRLSSASPGREPALIGRAVHQDARAEFGGQIAQPRASRRPCGGAVPHRQRRDRQSCGRAQQLVQAGDGDAGVGGGAPRIRRASTPQQMRLVGHRERRHFDAVIAERRGKRALPRERHVGDDFVAQGDMCVRSSARSSRSAGNARPMAAIALRPQRGRRHVGDECLITSTASTALIGRVKNGSGRRRYSTSPRRRLLSSMSPSTRPSTNGAIG